MLKPHLMIADRYAFLEEKYHRYNHPDFIENDPISIPHRFSRKEDIEISAFLVATIAWGQRPVIIRNGNRLVENMDLAPHDFVVNATGKELDRFNTFVHRTFNGIDCRYFLQRLAAAYREEGGLEPVFVRGVGKDSTDTCAAILGFRNWFFGAEHEKRTQKHVPNPSKGSSSKRLNMFLRWMVRNDNRGVDFGLWKGIGTDQLSIPLDVHTGNVARKLGLLSRRQNDWKAVQELDNELRKYDATDPVKYDFALFGLGVFEGF